MKAAAIPLVSFFVTLVVLFAVDYVRDRLARRREDRRMRRLFDREGRR